MFKLIEKTYKDEKYAFPYKYDSTLIVHMHYHTTRHYWDVGVYFLYPPHYRTEYVDGDEYVKTRKDARKIAQEFMKINPDIYWNKLSDFHKKLMVTKS